MDASDYGADAIPMALGNVRQIKQFISVRLTLDMFTALQVEVYMSPSATGRRGVKSKESSIPSDRFSILRMDASNINAVVILGGPGSAPQREQKIDAHQILQRNLRCKEFFQEALH